MKKLSIFAGLACLATIGGVFGTWVFGEATNNGTEKTGLKITVDTEVIENDAITLNAEATDLSFKFDQLEEKSTQAKVTLGGSVKVNLADDSTYTGKTPTYNLKAVLSCNAGASAYWTMPGEQIMVGEVGDNTFVSTNNFKPTYKTSKKITNNSDVVTFNNAMTNGEWKLTFSVEVTF